MQAAQAQLQLAAITTVSNSWRDVQKNCGAIIVTPEALNTATQAIKVFLIEDCSPFCNVAILNGLRLFWQWQLH